MRRNKPRWKRFRMVRVAEATLRRLEKLVPGSPSLAESIEQAVRALERERNAQEPYVDELTGHTLGVKGPH